MKIRKRQRCMTCSGWLRVDWSFTVPGIPKPKGRGRIGMHADGRKTKAGKKAWIYTPYTTRAFELKVAGLANEAGVRIGAGPGGVRIRLWAPPAGAADFDADNVLKCVIDGLVKGGAAVLEDDNWRVVRVKHAEIAGTSYEPRVEVDAWLIEEDLVEEPL